MPARIAVVPRRNPLNSATWNAVLGLVLAALAAPREGLAGDAPRVHAASRPTRTESRASCTTSGAATVVAPCPAVNAPGEAGLRVERDPESGCWRLSAFPLSESSQLSAALNQSSEGLVARPLAGGGEIVDLQGRFQSFSIVRRDLDGRLRVGCVDSASGLGWWLYGAAPTPAPTLSAYPEK